MNAVTTNLEPHGVFPLGLLSVGPPTVVRHFAGGRDKRLFIGVDHCFSAESIDHTLAGRTELLAKSRIIDQAE